MKKNNEPFIAAKTACLVQLLVLKNCPNLFEDQISVIDQIMGYVRNLKSEEEIKEEILEEAKKKGEDFTKKTKKEIGKSIACVIHSFLHDLNINHTIGQYELNAVIDKWKNVKDKLCEEYDITDNYLSNNLM